MIVIVRLSPKNFPPDKLNLYAMRINKKVICKFRHKRTAGLAQCLRRAAEAVESKELDEILQVLTFGGDIQ